MRRFLGVALGLMTITPLIACNAPPSDIGEAERAAIGDSVTAAMRSYEDAVKALDVDRIVGHYAADSQFRFIDNETVYAYDQLVDHVRRALPSLRSLEGGFSDIRVHALSRDIALADAGYLDIFTDSAGTVTRVRGTVTWVWARRPEGWRIVHGHAVALPDTTGNH